MNYDKIDTLLMAAGCRFEFLHGRDYEDFSPYKFAELIVRECVAVVDSMTDPEDSEQYFWAIQNASQKIKKHFGVES